MKQQAVITQCSGKAASGKLVWNQHNRKICWNELVLYYDPLQHLWKENAFKFTVICCSINCLNVNWIPKIINNPLWNKALSYFSKDRCPKLSRLWRLSGTFTLRTWNTKHFSMFVRGMLSFTRNLTRSPRFLWGWFSSAQSELPRGTVKRENLWLASIQGAWQYSMEGHILLKCKHTLQVFGVPHLARNQPIPGIWHFSPSLDQSLTLPPPRFVPENLKKTSFT